jgi:hypothetical protein
VKTNSGFPRRSGMNPGATIPRDHLPFLKVHPQNHKWTIINKPYVSQGLLLTILVMLRIINNHILDRSTWWLFNKVYPMFIPCTTCNSSWGSPFGTASTMLGGFVHITFHRLDREDLQEFLELCARHKAALCAVQLCAVKVVVYPNAAILIRKPMTHH